MEKIEKMTEERKRKTAYSSEIEHRLAFKKKWAEREDERRGRMNEAAGGAGEQLDLGEKMNIRPSAGELMQTDDGFKRYWELHRVKSTSLNAIIRKLRSAGDYAAVPSTVPESGRAAARKSLRTKLIQMSVGYSKLDKNNKARLIMCMEWEVEHFQREGKVSLN